MIATIIFIIVSMIVLMIILRAIIILIITMTILTIMWENSCSNAWSSFLEEPLRFRVP